MNYLIDFKRQLLGCLLVGCASCILTELLPANPGTENGTLYIAAIATENRFCDVRCPAKVLQPETEEDLRDYIRRELGSGATPRFTVKGGGHSYGCQSVLADSDRVLVDFSRMRHSNLTHKDGPVAELVLQAGLTFSDISGELHRQNLRLPHGECANVGFVGWALNSGNHPELDNFRRDYDEAGIGAGGHVKSIRGVTPLGSIFEVDEKGINPIDLSPFEGPWQATVPSIQAVGAGIQQGSPNLPVERSALSFFLSYGANFLIVTEITFQPLYNREPSFALLAWGLQTVARNRSLFDKIVGVVSNYSVGGVVCGSVLWTNFSRALGDAAVLKCLDWTSPGESIDGIFEHVRWHGLEPEQWRSSASAYWSPLVIPGLGWEPAHLFVYEFALAADAISFADRLFAVYQKLATIEDRRCRACFVEANYLGRFATWNSDIFCGDEPLNKGRCSAYTDELRELYLGVPNILPRWGTTHLPDCQSPKDGNPEAKWQDLYYLSGEFYNSLTQLKAIWDPSDTLDFWLGIHNNASRSPGTCDASGAFVHVDSRCADNGITAQHLFDAVQDKYRRQCSDFEEYVGSVLEMNTHCHDKIAEAATLSRVTQRKEIATKIGSELQSTIGTSPAPVGFNPPGGLVIPWHRWTTSLKNTRVTSTTTVTARNVTATTTTFDRSPALLYNPATGGAHVNSITMIFHLSFFLFV